MCVCERLYMYLFTSKKIKNKIKTQLMLKQNKFKSRKIIIVDDKNRETFFFYIYKYTSEADFTVYHFKIVLIIKEQQSCSALSFVVE